MGRGVAPNPNGRKVQPTRKTYEELNDKQKAFVEYYIQLQDANKAGRKAGFSDKNTAIGNYLLRKYGHIIKERMDQMGTANKRIADTEEILETLTRIIRGEEKDAFGLDVSNQDRLKALELLGKANQLYTDRVKTDTNMDINVNLVDDVEAVKELESEE